MDGEDKAVKVKEIKRYRSATITVVSNGFVVCIGCQTVVAETPEKLKALINGYLDDPQKAEKELYDNSIIFGKEQVNQSAQRPETACEAAAGRSGAALNIPTGTGGRF